MDFKNKFNFEWGSNDGSEPSDQLKSSGFTGGYKPPAGVFNWFFRKFMKGQTELQEAVNTVENKIPTKTSELTNDSNYVTGAELPESVQVVDNLTSTLTASALSANQGRVLKSEIDNKSDSSHTHNIATTSEAGLMSASDKSKLDGMLEGTSGIDELLLRKHGNTNNYVTGTKAVAEGDKAKAYGSYSHAEGYDTEASGDYSHAEGKGNAADNFASHVGGSASYAGGSCSFAHGSYARSEGDYSVAFGREITANSYQFALGYVNSIKPNGAFGSQDDNNTLFMIGNGTPSSGTTVAVPSNAVRVTAAGKLHTGNGIGTSPADFAEYFEWADGNPDDEDRRGLFVTLDGKKIRLATNEDDYILGVISSAPAFIGNTASENWQGKYIKDVFGDKIYQDVEIPEETNEETGEVIPAYISKQWVLNPDYNPNEEYISREFRKEWSPVGLLGQVIVVDDGTCQVNGYCKPFTDGIATAADSGYRVMERIDDTHIEVLIK